MVWTYVCKEEMWESVQEDALFLLWNILSLLVSKQNLCLFLLLWLPVFNPLEKMQKIEQGVEETREKRQSVLSPCALVHQSCEEGGEEGSRGHFMCVPIAAPSCNKWRFTPTGKQHNEACRWHKHLKAGEHACPSIRWLRQGVCALTHDFSPTWGDFSPTSR